MDQVTPAQRGHAAMLLFSALIAGSFSLGSMVANEIAPSALNAVRFVLAALVLAGVAYATNDLKRSNFRAPWRFVLLGGIFSAYFVLMFYGLQTAPPVSTAAVFTLTPVMSAVFGWLLLRQVTTPRMALALAIGGAGALVVIFQADWAAIRAFQIGEGELIYFWGCVAHAAYTPLVRKLNRGEPAVAFTLGMLMAGAVILFVFGWGEIVATQWLHLPVIVWIGVFYLAIFASASTFVLLQFATLHLPSAKVMAYTYLTPSWVILWELALGRAAPPGLIGVGIGMTIVALFLLLKDGDAPRKVTA